MGGVEGELTMNKEVIITASAAPLVTHEMALKVIEAILTSDDVAIGEMVGYGTDLFHCILIKKDEGTVLAMFGNEAEFQAAKDACSGNQMAFAPQQIDVDLT